MSGTRPYALGFEVMQRQPEPSDGKPQFPDAAARRRYNRPQKRSRHSRPRLRDDRPNKHHVSATRYATKKFQDTNLNRNDSNGFRNALTKKIQHNTDRSILFGNETPIKQYPQIKDVPQTSCSAETPTITKASVEHLDVIMAYCDEVTPEQPTSSSNAEADELMEEDHFIAVESPFPEADVEELYSIMREYLQVEEKYQPRLVLPAVPQRDEISASTRDGAVHVLRCLKVWYNLPTDVLFHAINLLDRFLTKMKVRPCHISCISVSCMNIAIASHRPQLPPISAEDLISISQCKCTAGDVRRMSAIVEEKLSGVGEAITPLQWVRLLSALFAWASRSLNLQDAFLPLIRDTEIINRLEILACDAACCNIRSCELALVLLCTQLNAQLMQRASSSRDQFQDFSRLVDFAMELQRICQINYESFYSSHQTVVGVLERYNARQKTPHRHRLIWRLSSRTMKVLRPTDKITSVLPTIKEQQCSGGYQQQQCDTSRTRMGSESSEDLNEDTKDWPTSPLVPVFCSDN